ncbi:MAG: hypothetical protein A2896_02785 [Candidatus Nealsonbacteria bacterium RIFCSPLOWO2_01_FULL_43_32]|uniref:FAD-binding FR-type domain-containing protein n=1 Tax=Candidatus Nealsonbacteria bacterium RIFCSPLOWO2_01_FULL_43_32 TaxID=1801672 RepID=A0A1G2EEC0_9BACT|nr:MAG: hypothetical protein A2896_02785 [Candidatus Nealsonbacteria bacterium RIFCSPLOWO2_01_FULL_43_32]
MKYYQFFHKKISGPFTIPAGIVTTEVSVLEKISQEIPEIGILTTKSIGLAPREGYREPILAQPYPSSFINAVGLTNPGVEEFAKRIAKIQIPDNKFLLISIFGKNEKEFQEVAARLRDFADGFELNLSCPHSDNYGQAVGQDKELVEKIVKSIVSLGKPVLVKVSPNLDVRETVKYALAGGISGFTAINTRGPEPYTHDGYPVLSNKVGGISGQAILDLGLKVVKEVRGMTDLPIIACGGIATREEVEKYKAAGADFFGIGSALAGMNTQELQEYFHALAVDIERDTNQAAGFLKDKLNTAYLEYKIEENEKLAEEFFLLKLDNSLKAEPGQFVFAWLPGKGEKPFSVFDDASLSLLIQKRGCFTKELAKLRPGETLYIRGPYGQSPKIEGKTLLVGGGSGIAGLYLFAKKHKKTIAVLGAKDKKHLPCLEKFRARSQQLYLATESGDMGDNGFVTDQLDEIMKKEKPDYCINCGPEAMVKEAIKKESKYLNQENIYSSAEFLTKCGIGLCGSCATATGYRACVDGTFLKRNRLIC